jgi:hypothetical protein
MKLNFENFERAQQALAAIPLFPIATWSSRDDETELSFRSVKLELKTNPTSNDSVKFSSYFKVFENGTSEQWCRWRDDLTIVFRGLNLTSGPNQIGIVRHLMSGQALDIFNSYFSEDEVSETLGHVQRGLKKVAATVFPDNAVANQKQYMRHELRKPNKLTSRETSTRVEQLNTWFEYFPADGANRYSAVTKLTNDELREIFYRLLPAAWRRKMEENVQFDRISKGLRGVVEYAERLETLESRFDPRGTKDSHKKSHSGKTKSEGHSKSTSESGRANSRGSDYSLPKWTKDCLVHGEGCGHPSHKCKTLRDHAEKVRNQFKAQPRGQSQRKVYGKPTHAKPWQKSNTSDRSYSHKEVQMLFQRQQERDQAKQAKEAENFQLEQPEAYEAESALGAMTFDDQAVLDNELDSFFME